MFAKPDTAPTLRDVSRTARHRGITATQLVAERAIRPAHLPLPTPANLPFQFSNGSQSSNAMCESGDGRSSPITQQNAGSEGTVSVDPGGTNTPRSTAVAEAMTVFSSLSVAICSHVVDALPATIVGRAPAAATEANAAIARSGV
jgi:hypothetical protein